MSVLKSCVCLYIILLSLQLLSANENVEILYNSEIDIAGFQFQVEGTTVVSAYDGDAAAAGFMLSTGPNTVLGFSLTGGVIPAGSGVLIVLEVEDNADDVCIFDVVISDSLAPSNTGVAKGIPSAKLFDNSTIFK